MKTQITAIENDKIQFENIEHKKLKVGQWIEVKTVRPLSMEQDIMQRLRGLWYLLLAELTKQTGYSQVFWKKELKTNAGFFITIKEPDDNVTRELKSVGGECTLEEFSQLFTHSFYWLLEHEIINLGTFQQKYFDIKGQELIANG